MAPSYGSRRFPGPLSRVLDLVAFPPDDYYFCDRRKGNPSRTRFLVFPAGD